MVERSRNPFPVVCGFIAYILVILILVFEGVIFFRFRAPDFLAASNGDLFEEGHNGHCVSYADPGGVKDAFNGKVGQVYVLTIGAFALGGRDASCDVSVCREDLASLVVASVHALKYTADLAPTPAVTETAAAAMQVALGTSNLVLNYSVALDALKSLSEPPTSCDYIYNINSTDLFLGDALTTGAGFEIICGGETSYAASLSLTSTHLHLLHRHCTEQFQIGRFGDKYDSFSLGWSQTGMGGTRGIPVHGNVLEPGFLPWSATPGFNDTSTWQTRTTVLTGYRFGLGAFATVASVLFGVFLLLDTFYFLLVHVTLQARISELAKGSLDESVTISNMLSVYATAQAMRNERMFLSLFGWITIIIFKSVFVFAVFDFGRILPRGECEAGSGWKHEDWSGLEVGIIWLYLLVIFIPPFSASAACAPKTNMAYTSLSEAPEKAVITDGARSIRRYFGVTALGVVAMLVGAIFVAAAFGTAWAEAVAYGFPGATEEPRWDVDALANGVFSRTIGALGIAITGGIALASILARFLFAGRTCCACIVLIIWLIFALMSLLPLFVLEKFSFDKADFDKNCDFDGGTTACNVRFFSFIVGFILIFLPILIITLSCICTLRNVPCNGKVIGSARRGGVFKGVRKRFSRAFRRAGAPRPITASREALPLLNVKVS